MRTELIKAPFSESFGLLQAEWKRIYLGIIKIELVSITLALIGVLAAAGILFGLSWLGVIATIVLAAAVLMPLILVSAMVRLLSYSLVDSIWSRKKISLGEKFRENALPVIGFMVVRALISLVIIGPIVALMFVFLLGSMASDSAYFLSILLNLVFRIAIWVAAAAIALFTQFAVFELLISGNGVLDSFGKSYSIVRRNFYETFIFSFILAILGGLITTPFILLLVIIVIVGLFAGIALSGAAGVAVIALTLIICFAIMVAMQAALETVTIPTQYKYWSRARLAR
ncbi:MAG TPA: hypothetical protein VLD37_01820 [Candidatus Bilamarchaeum sp.]|nr:hypothetical protein [Candidatus Bilamarchaeum sp.]